MAARGERARERYIEQQARRSNFAGSKTDAHTENKRGDAAPTGLFTTVAAEISSRCVTGRRLTAQICLSGTRRGDTETEASHRARLDEGRKWVTFGPHDRAKEATSGPCQGGDVASTPLPGAKDGLRRSGEASRDRPFGVGRMSMIERARKEGVEVA